MEPIRLDTPEALRQYRADCRADYKAAKLARPVIPSNIFSHDTSMVGKWILVPKNLLDFRFTKVELNALAR